MAAMKARTTSEETAAAKQKRKDNAAAKRQRAGEVQSALRTWLEAQPANSMKKGAIVSWAKDGGYGEVYQENWLRKRNGQRGNDAIHDAWQRASKYTLPSSSAPASSSSSSTKSGPSMSSPSASSVHCTSSEKAGVPAAAPAAAGVVHGAGLDDVPTSQEGSVNAAEPAASSKGPLPASAVAYQRCGGWTCEAASTLLETVLSVPRADPEMDAEVLVGAADVDFDAILKACAGSIPDPVCGTQPATGLYLRSVWNSAWFKNSYRDRALHRSSYKRSAKISKEFYKSLSKEYENYTQAIDVQPAASSPLSSSPAHAAVRRLHVTQCASSRYCFANAVNMVAQVQVISEDSLRKAETAVSTKDAQLLAALLAESGVGGVMAASLPKGIMVRDFPLVFTILGSNNELFF